MFHESRINLEEQELLSLTSFLTISARINYLLSSRAPSYEALVNGLIQNRPLCGSLATIEDGVAYLVSAYRNRSRRLGPLAVIHPMRASHLLILACEEPYELDILTAFFHDYYEDIYTDDQPENIRQELGQKMAALTERLSPEERDILYHRMQVLTRRDSEDYNEYLGRMIEQAVDQPEILWVKLADRLDNTMDMRIVENESGEFFRLIFDVLFLQTRQKRVTVTQKPPPGQMDEAHRLYQMFKNAIFLTLVRRSEIIKDGSGPAIRLFHALAAASLQESGRILTHIFSYHILDAEKQRDILIDAMEYCIGGGINRITPSQRGNRLDGLFTNHFDHPERKVREQNLRTLQEDKSMMASAALAFISLFESFLTSPNFKLSGVHATGISIEDTLI
ncbi:MAG TPA: hypothetical protein DCE42_30280 [Myxococcales bacterium]|nr:hypothetical protein [Deltaproteobacteria bacterium]MBU49018.1 hypothetical protein [Deltaproteobacteria bacterium]HAA59081.1 hypothetical protein [Myxococcales bacterium]|tara:strand:- start:19732 stop:20910 length:1179 start_codon:yes stop_codon:yes gene_type:complete